MQTSIPIFNSNSFDTLLEEMGLRHIAVEENARLKKSWRISRVNSHYTLSIPTTLMQAPDTIKRTLLTWASLYTEAGLQKKAISTEHKKILKSLEHEIWNHLYCTAEVEKHPLYREPSKQFRCAAGTTYDLYPLFEKINREWFEGTLLSFLRWGRFGSRTSYHRMIVDEHKNEHHLITIAGLYNHPGVPQFALESVLYHEMLHIACPPIVSGGRRQVHHKEFKRREKEFTHYNAWQKWQNGKTFSLFRRK